MYTITINLLKNKIINNENRLKRLLDSIFGRLFPLFVKIFNANFFQIDIRFD